MDNEKNLILSLIKRTEDNFIHWKYDGMRVVSCHKGNMYSTVLRDNSHIYLFIPMSSGSSMLFLSHRTCKNPYDVHVICGSCYNDELDRLQLAVSEKANYEVYNDFIEYFMIYINKTT